MISYENPRMTKEQRDLLVARQGHPLTWSRYHRYGDILRYIEFLVYTYPNLVELINIGYSSNGQPLKVVKVSSDVRREDLEFGEAKPAIWIDGGMNGREWVTSAAVLYIVRQLVEKYSKNKRLVDSADWYILPMANPDGYEYSHTTDRLWTKTRSNHDNSATNIALNLMYGACEGVDLSHNFDYKWGEPGASDDPCSDRYAGPRPLSEPEAKAITDFVLGKRRDLKMFLTVHTYSQKFIIPSGSKSKKVEDFEAMMSMARKAVDAMGRVSDSRYEVSAPNGRKEAKTATGTSDNWAKNAAGVKFSYRLELRDKGTYGYILPATQILPTSKETFVAVKAMAKSIICKH